MRGSMEKIGSLNKEASAAPELLSQQVSDARYCFVDLAPQRALALAFAGRETCNPDYEVRRAHYAYTGLEYVAEGAGRVALDGRPAELGPGSVFAYGPHTSCTIRTDPARPMMKYFLCLAGPDRTVARRLDAAGLRPAEVVTPAAHAELRSAWEELIREGRRQGPRTRALCAALLEVLLLKLADAIALAGSAAGASAESTFLRCKALIDANLDRALTLEDVATAAGLEVSSVCRLFRRYQGTSPYRYLLRQKMNLAAEFLVETGGTVKEAAHRVGFADPFHFSRVFKQVHGIAPRELRRHRDSGDRDARPVPRAGQPIPPR
jgi:AraC family transcriptional regulator